MNDVVTVTITRIGQLVKRDSFGILMILGAHKKFNERVKYYLTLDAVAQDFLTTEKEYIAAKAVFDQSPNVEKIAIGRQQIDDVTVTVDTVENNTNYTVTISGTDYQITSDADATAEEIAAALVSAIDAGSEPVDATDNLDGTFTVSSDPALSAYTILVDSNMSIVNGSASETVTQALDAILNDDDAWYSLALTSRVQAEVELAAAWTEANNRLFGTASDDTDILDINATGDIADVFKTAEYERSYCMYHSAAATTYPECAWYGVMLTKDPGTATWAFKTLTNVTVDDLTETQKIAALAKNANIYVSEYGKNITRDGNLAKDEFFIDTTRGIDWLAARINEDVAALILNTNKIPYTDGGISAIEAVIKARLENAVEIGLLSPSPAPVVTVPKLANIPVADRNIRKVSGITFRATLAGAIHQVIIEGFVI